MRFVALGLGTEIGFGTQWGTVPRVRYDVVAGLGGDEFMCGFRARTPAAPADASSRSASQGFAVESVRPARALSATGWAALLALAAG